MQVEEISCKVVMVASFWASYAWTLATTLLVWGVVAASNSLSIPLFCTISIIGGGLLAVAFVVPVISITGCSGAELSLLRCAQFPVLLRILEAGGVLSLKDGISGGFFLATSSCAMSLSSLSTRACKQS